MTAEAVRSCEGVPRGGPTGGPTSRGSSWLSSRIANISFCRYAALSSKFTWSEVASTAKGDQISAVTPEGVVLRPQIVVRGRAECAFTR